MLVSTATVTGQGTSPGGYLSEGWGFSVAKSGEFSHGHQRGPKLAITEDFLMAMDIRMKYEIPNGTSYGWVSGLPPGISRNGEPVWQQVARQLQEPVLASGLNATAQQDDQFWTLVAAILFGLATAFLVDGIRGLLESRRERLII